MAEKRIPTYLSIGEDTERQLTRMCIAVCQEDFDNGRASKEEIINRLTVMTGSVVATALLEFPE